LVRPIENELEVQDESQLPSLIKSLEYGAGNTSLEGVLINSFVSDLSD